MRILLSMVIISILLLGCKKSSTSKIEATNYTVVQKNFLEKTEKYDVKIAYPMLADSILYARTNKIILSKLFNTNHIMRGIVFRIDEVLKAKLKTIIVSDLSVYEKMKSIMSTYYDYNKEDHYKNFKKEDRRDPFPQYSLHVDYEILKPVDSVLSMVFSFETYAPLDAHPDKHTKTVNINLNNQQEIHLQDILTNVQGVEKALMSLINKKIDEYAKKNELDCEQFSEIDKLTPYLENFGLVNEKIVFYFSDNAYCCYACGSPPIEIELEVLKNMGLLR